MKNKIYNKFSHHLLIMFTFFNPLESRGIVPHQIIWSWYTGRWCMGCYIWYSEEGTGRGPSPPRLLLAVPNVTAHPSTASVPITVLLYGPLLCGFDVGIKGLITSSKTSFADDICAVKWWQKKSKFLSVNDAIIRNHATVSLCGRRRRTFRSSLKPINFLW